MFLRNYLMATLGNNRQVGLAAHRQEARHSGLAAQTSSRIKKNQAPYYAMIFMMTNLKIKPEIKF